MTGNIPFGANRSFVRTSIALALLAFANGGAAKAAGEGRWADKNDPVANQLIENERKWATLACAPSATRDAAAAALVNDFIAADFIGTSPKGSLYSKADMLPKDKPAKALETEQDCKLLSARVRYFGSDVAVIYGSESAVVKDADGKAAPRTLIWTDTLLRRAGKWQVIAVQDMVARAK